ncbi:MAG: hypothetical protein CR217_04265 [Beijerinckiaceae bacterium]|nr:MAG: hypothetical protein CR217_04265 [Beijerinckiaceae bacterium]
MKLSLVSLAVGLVVGALYGVLNVRSPSPPVVALVGLLGTLMGEQIPPLVRHIFARRPASVTWIDQVKPHNPNSAISGGAGDRTPLSPQPTLTRSPISNEMRKAAMAAFMPVA